MCLAVAQESRADRGKIQAPTVVLQEDFERFATGIYPDVPFSKYWKTIDWAHLYGKLAVVEDETKGKVLPVILCAVFQPIFFYCTKYFYRDHQDERATELQEFIDNQAKPVMAADHEECLDHAQGKMLGSLAGVYGGFVLLVGAVVLIINLIKGNPVTPMSIFAFLGIGGAVGILGWVLAHAYKPKKS